MDYERRQVYRGPEKIVDTPPEQCRKWTTPLTSWMNPDNGVMASGSECRLQLAKAAGWRAVEPLREGLKPAQSGLSDKRHPTRKTPGRHHSCRQDPKGLGNHAVPEVEGAFVAD